MKNICSLLIVSSILLLAASAQTKRKPRPKSVPKPAATQTVKINSEDKTEEAVVPVKVPVKKNERAENPMSIESSENNLPPEGNESNLVANKANAAASRLPFRYEFSQPKFNVSRVIIEHDADGKGKITFYKQDIDEPLSDPLIISAKASEKIQNLWATLNLIESKENYQSPERDYAHLGTMKLRRLQGDMARTIEFNWTENPDAKMLTDEYKKLTEQYVWIFDMNIARENQPLNSPQLIDRLDSLLNRNQLSDPKQMLAFLREVTDDERLPLIARNHTTKIIQRVEKMKEK